MKNTSNSGNTVIEATLILPIFIFSMLTLYYMAQCKIAENMVYDAAVETSEYLAQLAYNDESVVSAPGLVYPKYVDDPKLLGKYIQGGVEGINFLGTTGIDEEGYFTIKVTYTTKVSVPLMPVLSKEKTISIKQRAYTGKNHTSNSEDGSQDTYVYVTENREAYHQTRLCTYLELEIGVVNKNVAAKMGYTACIFCGSKAGDKVLITKYGGKYHSSYQCSGLKRTIYRVKKSEVEGLEGCIRCTGQ